MNALRAAWRNPITVPIAIITLAGLMDSIADAAVWLLGAL